jgi:hypothetical protein
MLAVAASPHGLTTALSSEATLFQELPTLGLLQTQVPVEYRWQNIGLGPRINAQQLRKRPRVATFKNGCWYILYFLLYKKDTPHIRMKSLLYLTR